MKGLNELSNLSGTFFLQEVYNKMSINLNFNTDNNSKIITNDKAINYERIKPIHLTTLGFTKGKDETFIFEDVKISLKHYFSEITINDKKWAEASYINQIGKLINFLNSKTNHNFDISKIENLVGVKAELLNFKEELNKTLNEFKDVKDSEKIISTLLRVMLRTFDNEHNIFRNHNIYVDNILHKIITENLDINTLDKVFFDLDSFNVFENSMVATNTPYMPSYSGHQNGCIEINKYLNEITSSIIEDRMKDYEMDMEMEND